MKIGVIVPRVGRANTKVGTQKMPGPEHVTSRGKPEALGFESIWLFDHFHTVPRPTVEITFEAFTSLAALAAETESR